MNHPSLDMRNNESTMEQLKEERSRVRDIADGMTIPFPLDSTMTIVRKDGNLALHSVVPLDRYLLAEIQKLGNVALFLAPNLQHWLFLNDWLNEFPNASVGLVPSAFDEDLNTNIPRLGEHHGHVVQLKTGTEAELENFGLVGKLLEGAPLSLNEYLFFHKSSGTLIASDSFYGGYAHSETPTWFARLWFKLTKAGSFRAVRLPIYRTSRVLSHGDKYKLLSCACAFISDCQVKQITFAHGTSPFNQQRMDEMGIANSNPGQVYLDCWLMGLAVLMK